MKKIILSCALALAAGTAFAQQSNVNRAEMALGRATQNPKEIDYEEVDKAWEFIQLAMVHEKSINNPQTWDLAGRIQSMYMNKMLNDRNVTGELDEKKFFENQKMIIEYYLKCDDVEHTPNAKGKMPKEVFRPKNVNVVKSIRPNLRNAGGMLSTSDPDLSIMYINYYNETGKHPIFTGMTDIADSETATGDLAYYLATAYKTKGDTVNAIPALEKALASDEYGKYACGELIMILDKLGKTEEKNKFIQIGYEKYPELAQYGQWLLADKLEKKDWDASLKLCDELIQRFPEDMYAHYNKGRVLFELKRFEDAIAAYVQASEVEPGNVEVLSMAGRSAMMNANINADKKEIRDAAFAQAIDFFERVKSIAPEKTDLYGYELYVCYKNTNQNAKAKPYEKYYSK